MKSLPFQMSIEYKALSGMKCVRVITKLQMMEDDKEKIREAANFEIMGAHAAQQSAAIARKGESRKA
jgi:hypothetical protein